MNKSIRMIFIVCIAAVGGVIVLQIIWITNYYQINRERFEKEVNVAFEDAIKTDFKLRCDTLEQLMYNFVMDTSQIDITSRWNNNSQAFVYTVANKKDTLDKHSFSHKMLNFPIFSKGDTVKQLVARHYARTYREEDLERHVIYYHTQNLGKYIHKWVDNYKFDTARLRPVYFRLLAERGILEPFIFYLRDEDNTLNRNRFPERLQRSYPVITKSFPTYELTSGENFVRAMFKPPVSYLYKKMAGIVLASGLLLCVVAFALYYLLRVIGRQKKLADIKNDFISNISHEFKTPIATVTAAIEAMEGFGVLSNQVKTKRYLNISKNELQRLTDMVNKLMELSLYEKQDTELNKALVNMNDIIGELVSGYSLAGKKKITFNYHNHAGTNMVMADQHHLYNVLNNLIDNAIKYSGEAVNIDITFFRDKEFFVITIKDDGIGISQSNLSFIFEKFYRVPSGNIHKVKGYGLGLSYVKYIMEKQGGWCVAESKPGSGSIFKLGLKA